MRQLSFVFFALVFTMTAAFAQQSNTLFATLNLNAPAGNAVRPLSVDQ